jgi:Pyruvate/2-oxoacid:ferredoxin oxidoreductase delta subunit
MGKIILDFGEGWNAKFLESIYKNNNYDAGSMADDMIRIQLKEAIFTDELNKGKWIFAYGTKGKDNVERCSCCGSHWKEAVIYTSDTREYLRTRLLYCPNCGSRNEVEEND